jgi:hypothetical protein
MEFREIIGFELDGVSYDRSGFKNGIGTEYENVLYNHLNYGEMSGYVSEDQVRGLIQSNIASGYLTENNGIKYYALANRDFAGSFFNGDGSEAEPPSGAAAVAEVFPMWGSIREPVITGGLTNLMYIAFHVITALEDGTLLTEIYEGSQLTRALNKGDQMIRWYIPAGLIPQRRVDPDTGTVTGNRLPIRVHYTAGLNGERVEEGISPEYIAANFVPNTLNEVYFYANQFLENVTLSFYRPHEDNPFYKYGRPGNNERGVVKSSNATDTAPHVSLNRYSGEADLHWLGNNGRLSVSFTAPPEPGGSLTVTKAFEGLPDGISVYDYVSPITFLIVGNDSSGNELYRETKAFAPEIFEWAPVGNRYELTLTNLPLGIYRVYERGGHADGYILPRPEPPELILLTTPGEHISVNFINNYTPVTEPQAFSLTVRKVFHGLTDDELPEGFYIVITGPGDFYEILSLYEAIEGRAFISLLPGIYTITEYNGAVAGFDLSDTQPLMPHTVIIGGNDD